MIGKNIMEDSIQIQNSFLTETVLNTTITELKKLKLSSKDYVNLANSILDIAINGHKTPQVEEVNYLIDEKIDFPIKYEDIIINKFDNKKHKKLLMEWTNNEFGKEFLLSRIDNVERNLDELINDKANIFGIIETQDKIPIGIMGYLHYDKLNNKAELRKLIGNRDYSGKGFGKKATKAWVSFGLNKLKLRKIFIYTFDTNLRNIRINRELGFNLEGVFKAENLDKDAPKDILRMALITK
jgi:RimJ/RimL family protein N-acetyltransferase